MVCSEMSSTKLEKNSQPLPESEILPQPFLELMNMHPNEMPPRSANKLPSRLEPLAKQLWMPWKSMEIPRNLPSKYGFLHFVRTFCGV